MAGVGFGLGATDVCGATDVGFGLAGICVDLGFNDDCRRLGPADVWDLQTSVSCRRLFWLVWDLQARLFWLVWDLQTSVGRRLLAGVCLQASGG